LQPLFTGIHAGDRAAENQAARAGFRYQRFTLGYRLLHLFVGISENIAQRFSPTWVDGFGTG
jgi:hypothetical protein